VPLLIRIANRLEEALIGLLLAAMTLVTFVQIVLRYVFNSGFTWAMEATTFLFGWMVLLGISYGVKVGSHIGVDVWVKKLGERNRRIVGIVASLLCVAYAVLMLVAAWNYERSLYAVGIDADDIPVQRWILLLALPVGFALLVWRIAQLAWRILTGKQTSVLVADEAAEIILDLKADSSFAQEARR